MARSIVKQVKNAILYDDGCIRVDNVRASYPHLAVAWAKDEGDRPKFGITGLGDKKTHEEAKKLCVEVINKLLSDGNMGKIGSEHKFCKDGDNAGKDECEGMWIFRASENADRRPPVRDRKGNLISEKNIAEVVYPGCYVNILIRPWAQNNKHGKKINANLIGVQYVGPGERFGDAPIDDEDAWEEIEGEDTDLDLDDDDDL